MEFIPSALKVKAGDSVIWINKDLVVHDVTEQATKEWASSPIPMDSSWKMVVVKSADYFCSIHTMMKGKLIVEQ